MGGGSAPLPGAGAARRPAVGGALGVLADGGRGLGLAEQGPGAGPLGPRGQHHAGLDLLQVVRLRPQLGLQQPHVALVAPLLLTGGGGEIQGSVDLEV